MTPQDPQPPQNPSTPPGPPPGQGTPPTPPQANQPGRPAGPPPGRPGQGQPGPGMPPGAPPFQGPPGPPPGPARPPFQGGPVPPFQGPPGAQPPGPPFQGPPNMPSPGPGPNAPAMAAPQMQQNKPGFGAVLAAFRPEPSKAPPLEWAGLVVSILLIICGFLPWVSYADSSSLTGIDATIGDGWIVAGAGLGAAIMGFVGLSRDSIALAAGQALVGLIALLFAIFNVTGLANGEGAAFGLILTIIVAVIVIVLGLYNAYDALRKGAKY